MKILIATDDSEHSKNMLTEFSKRTFSPSTEIRIVSAYEISSYVTHNAAMGAWSMYYDSAIDGAKNQAKDSVKKGVALIKKKQPKLLVNGIAIEGGAKKVILSEAEKFKADLIVVGSHGRGYVAGFLMGSVSQSIALHAKCSVEIVRHAIEPKGKKINSKKQ
jgi:nucleotide-binding universal stress UspA family protein